MTLSGEGGLLWSPSSFPLPAAVVLAVAAALFDSNEEEEELELDDADDD